MCKVDRKRLARAFGCKVQEMTDGSQRVWRDGRPVHRVRYASRWCDCEDHAKRGILCLHLLAVLLSRLEPARMARAAQWCGVLTQEEA